MQSTPYIIGRVSERITQAALYGVLLTPLLVASSLLIFPFITTKVFFFRSVIILALAASIVYRGARVFRNGGALGASICIYFGVAFLSAVFGVDFYRSWWGNHERMVGLFTVLHGVLYFFLLTAYMRGSSGAEDVPLLERWRPYLIAAVSISTVVAAIGILQRAGFPILHAPPGGRAWSSFGNFIYLATFSSFFLWILGILMLIERRRALFIAYSVAIALHLVAFIFAESRGAYIGLAFGLCVAAGAALIFLSPRARRRIVAAMIIVVAAVTLVRVFDASRFVRTTPVLRNIASISLGDVTAQTRIHAWRVGLRAWRERPLLGWGHENFYYAFNRFFDPRVLRYSVYETWFDNAHNVLVNTAATTGAIGLAAYLSIFGVAAYRLIKSVRSGALARPLFVLCMGLVATYFGNNFFVFDHPSSYLTLFLMLGFLSTVTAGRVHPTATATVAPHRREWRLVRAALVVPLGLLMIFRTNIQPMAANAATLTAIKKSQYGPRAAASAFKRALTIYSPHRLDILSDLMRQAFAFSVAFPESEETAYFLRYAIQEVENAPPGALRDLQFLLSKSQLYVLYSAYDPTALDRAMENIRASIALSPARQQIHAFAARIALLKGDPTGARAYGETLVSLDRDAGPAYWMRAQIYESLGDYGSAFEDIRTALSLNFRPSGEEDSKFFLRIVYGVYGADASRDTILTSLKGDTALLYMLGSAFYDVGRKEDMYATATFMRQIGVQDDFQSVVRTMLGR